MARFSLIVFAALLVAMAPVAKATPTNIVTVTTTTTTFNDNPHDTSGIHSYCVQKGTDEQLSLFHCFRYLLFFTEGTQDQKDKQVCCTELKSFGEKCTCPMIIFLMSQPYWRNLGNWESTISEASNLPTHCNVMSQSCKME